jgi:hypothetical protein
MKGGRDMPFPLKPCALILLFAPALIGIDVAYSAESVEEQIRKIASETQKSLPMRLSDDLIATNVATVGKIMVYRYNFTKSLASIPNVPSLKSDAYRTSVNSACTNPTSINALKQGVSYQYEFYDSQNNFVMQFSVDRASCGR